MQSILKESVKGVALFFIVLFCYAATNKMFDFENFQDMLRQAPKLMEYGQYLAYTLVTLQLIIVLLLCWKFTRFLGFALAAVLLIFITIYIGMMLVFAKNLPCTCLGIMEGLSWKQNFWLSFSLLFLAFSGLVLSQNKTPKGAKIESKGK